MRVFDNGGQTFDRYTVFPWGNDEALLLSHNCDSPQGVSMYASPAYADGAEINFAELPANVRAHVRARLAEMDAG